MKLLTGCVSSGSRNMPFVLPMAWRNPKDHSSDCYPCLTNIKRITSESKHLIKYPDLPFAVRLVPHNEELLVPKSPLNLTFSDDNSVCDEDHDSKKGTMLIAIRHFK